MTETQTHQGIKLTDAAVNRIGALIQADANPDLRLRIEVKLGGCAGMQYDLWFDQEQTDGDILYAFGDVEVVVDPMSDAYLSGATIDYEDTIMKQGLTIDNPNAQGTCACGSSFSG